MESREQRIATLATTLRSSGIAKSDSQAKMMAEDMIGVEEHVQKSYEVEHTRAQEYLQTAKNLGTPRQVIAPIKQEAKQDARQEQSRKIEPITQNTSSRIESVTASRTEPVNAAKSNPKVTSEYTDVSFGSKTLNEVKADHNTHNSAIEAIKAQIGNEKIVPLEDMNGVMEDNTYKDYTKIAIKSEPLTSQRLSEIRVKDEEDVSEVEEDVGIKTDVELESTKEVVLEPQPEALEPKKIKEPVEEQQDIQTEEPQLKVEQVEPKLDAQRLIDMMEEDGKLEEHTREIKEKPKDVKPKEAYAENNIDLAAIFGAGRK